MRLSGYRRRAAAREEAPPAALEEDDECASLLAGLMDAAPALSCDGDLQSACLKQRIDTSPVSCVSAQRRSLLGRVVQRGSVL